MKSLRHIALLSLIVLLMAGCSVLPPITANPTPLQQPAATEPPAVRAPAEATVEAAPAITTTVALTPTVPLEATAVISPTAAVTTTEAAGQPPAAEAPATPTEEQVMGANPLVGVVWEWAALLKTNPSAQSVVPDPSSYTIIFADNGDLLIKADCNNVRGTYTLENDQLKIKAGAATLVGCSPGSLGDSMLTSLTRVTTYMIDAGDLILRLAYTGDSMLFRNGGPSAAPAPAPATAVTAAPPAPAATEAPAGAPLEMTPTPTPVVATGEAAAGAPAAVAPPLVGTTWQWEQLVDVASGKAGEVIKNPEKYTVTFGADGKVAMKSDCNNAAGTYKVEGTKLTVEVGPVTLAVCGAGSMTDLFLIDLTSATGFLLDGGKLNVDLMADGGRMVFGAAK